MAIETLTNMPAINARRHMLKTQRDLSKTLERLASGKRINQPGDDAAGLAISDTLRARIASVDRSNQNAKDAFSLLQVAGGSIQQIGDKIVRMRELAMQAASDTVGDRERELIEIENGELKAEVDRIAGSVSYLSTPLMNGEGDDFQFQIGPDNNENNRISYSADGVDVTAGALGVDSVDLSDRDSALSSLDDIDEGLTRLHTPMAQLGALQNRMETVIDHLDNYSESLTAANSRILDADYAKESTEAFKHNVRLKAGVAVLAQANQLPGNALNLL